MKEKIIKALLQVLVIVVAIISIGIGCITKGVMIDIISGAVVAICFEGYTWVDKQ